VLANYNYNHGTNDSYIVAVYDNYEPLHPDMRDYDTSNANNGSLQADLRYNFKGGLALSTGAKYESSCGSVILRCEANYPHDSKNTNRDQHRIFRKKHIGHEQNVAIVHPNMLCFPVD
jgi:hypothetical protein